jgi:hypothetical protein
VDNLDIVEVPTEALTGITKYTLDILEVSESTTGITVSKQRTLLIHVQGDGTAKETAYCANSLPINTLIPVLPDEKEVDYYTRIKAAKKSVDDKIKVK